MVHLDTGFIATFAIAETSSKSVEAFLLRRRRTESPRGMSMYPKGGMA